MPLRAPTLAARRIQALFAIGARTLFIPTPVETKTTTNSTQTINVINERP